MLQAEVVQVHIVGNIVITVDTAGVVAVADATAAQIQTQPLGRIGFAQKRLTGGGGHTVQREPGGIHEAQPRGSAGKDTI
jgi:hypothetical protein